MFVEFLVSLLMRLMHFWLNRSTRILEVHSRFGDWGFVKFFCSWSWNWCLALSPERFELVHCLLHNEQLEKWWSNYTSLDLQVLDLVDLTLPAQVRIWLFMVLYKFVYSPEYLVKIITFDIFQVVKLVQLCSQQFLLFSLQLLISLPWKQHKSLMAFQEDESDEATNLFPHHQTFKHLQLSKYITVWNIRPVILSWWICIVHFVRNFYSN